MVTTRVNGCQTVTTGTIFMSQLIRLIDHLKKEQRRYYLTEMPEEPFYRRWFYGGICFVSIFWTEVRNMRLFIRVASGTYTTMLALIPFMVVGGSLVLTFNKKATIPELVKQINEFVIPVAGDTIANFLTESLTRTLDIGLGPIGVISLLITSVMLFVHIEDCINDIWHVVKPRAFYLRILLFYAVVTLGPLLISFSIFQAAQFLSEYMLDGIVWKLLRDVSILTGACFIVFKFMPNTRVQLKYAFIPAIVAGIVIEIAKLSFGFYLSIAFQSTSNNTILYGALGIIPVVLLWLYLSWMMILFGVEASYCMQNMRSLCLRKCYTDENNDHETWIFIGAYAALEILSSLVRNLCRGGNPQTSEELAVECVYPVQAIDAILDRLVAINVVKRIDGEFARAYFLARPLDAILIRDIMKAFDESSPRVKKFPKLEGLVNQLLAAQENIWADSNANILREDGVTLKDVASCSTMTNLHLE